MYYAVFARCYSIPVDPLRCNLHAMLVHMFMQYNTNNVFPFHSTAILGMHGGISQTTMMTTTTMATLTMFTTPTTRRM